MSPMEWLRRQKKPMTAEHQARFLEIAEVVNVGIRAARSVTPESRPPQPPRDLSWENAARIVATCTCEPTLYSRCYPSLHGGRPEA